MIMLITPLCLALQPDAQGQTHCAEWAVGPLLPHMPSLRSYVSHALSKHHDQVLPPFSWPRQSTLRGVGGRFLFFLVLFKTTLRVP